MKIKNILSFVIAPVFVVVFFFQIGSMPLYGLGNHERGLLTFGIAILGLLTGILLVHSAFRGKIHGEGLNFWKMIAALILVIPALFQLAVAH